MSDETKRLNLENLEVVKKSNSICKHNVKAGAGCAPCAAEHKLKIKEEDQIRAESEKSEHAKGNIATAFRFSGIKGVGLTRYFKNYNIYNEKQDSIVRKCKEYALNFNQVLKHGASMLFVGGPGSGKNHLAYAIANRVINQGYKALFYEAFDIFLELHDTRQNGYTGPGQKAIIEKFTKPDLLIIDEIGVQSKTAFEENVIFKIINNRRNLWKPVILISNCTVKTMAEYIGARCLDRVKEGSEKGECVLNFNWPSYRSRVFSDPNLPVNQTLNNRGEK